MSRKRCRVINCGDRHEVLHAFPKPHTERFLMWLSATGDKSLMDVDPERLHKSYHICRKHFCSNYLMNNNKVAVTAVPTLYLPETPVIASTSADPDIHPLAVDLPETPATASTPPNPDIHPLTVGLLVLRDFICV